MENTVEFQQIDNGISSEVNLPLSSHKLDRMQREAAMIKQTIENRIKFFNREEVKMWRDLEGVRRHAIKLEDGRIRLLEKRLAEKAIAQSKELEINAARVRAQSMKELRESQPLSAIYKIYLENNKKCTDVKLQSQENLRVKHLHEAQVRFYNTMRAQALQKQHLEAKGKHQHRLIDRQVRLQTLREERQNEANKRLQEVADVIPFLERLEHQGLERLQASRLVTVSVFKELETSIGDRTTAALLSRTPSRVQTTKSQDRRPKTAGNQF